MAKQLTRRQIRRLAEDRYEREPTYEESQSRRVSGWEKMMYIILIIMCFAVLWNVVIIPTLYPAPHSPAPALPTAALPPTQSAPPPAQQYQQAPVAPQAAPTAPPAVPTAVPATRAPEPVVMPMPEAGAHPQQPTKGTIGGRENRRDAPPQLSGKPRK